IEFLRNTHFLAYLKVVSDSGPDFVVLGFGNHGYSGWVFQKLHFVIGEKFIRARPGAALDLAEHMDLDFIREIGDDFDRASIGLDDKLGELPAADDGKACFERSEERRVGKECRSGWGR